MSKKITNEAIEAVIVNEYYHRVPDSTVTLCTLTLKNGYRVNGESACISPENFNEQVGKELARVDAANKIWALEGYVEKERSNGTRLAEGAIKATVERIAEAAHEVNRIYCGSIGDNTQKVWAKAPEWQKESARNGVRFHLANPDSKPEDSHNNWLREKSAAGWSYGPKKNQREKLHPCMVPYDELPEEQKLKDALFCCLVKAFC